jgi:RNA polymerase sigma factor (TIGR02999 family)
MRSILVDHVRRRRAVKRGGGDYAVTLSWTRRERGDDFDLITLDEALNELAVERPRHSRIVELRFFGGLTIEETAQALGVSHATVEREWRLARAWLHREVSRETARRGAR